MPIFVYAGPVGSILGVIFGKGESSESFLVKQNIQNMNLLAANVSTSFSGNNNSILEGDALVPENSPLGTGNIHTLKPTSDQISVYVVREGDTISEIAKMFDVSINTIKWGNDLTSNNLKVGQTLIILPVSGVRHTVVKGDTVESLAKEYKSDFEEVLAFNNLERGSILEVGSIVIIPDGEISSPVNNVAPKSNGGKSENVDHKGYYLRPVIGGIRTQGIHGYNGIDIGAPIGTEILASADGEVIISRNSGWNGGYGNYIVIRHNNGTQTLYAHNSRNSVSVGEEVKKGQVVGFVGSSGKVTGPHLHFEIRGAKNPF